MKFIIDNIQKVPLIKPIIRALLLCGRLGFRLVVWVLTITGVAAKINQFAHFIFKHHFKKKEAAQPLKKIILASASEEVKATAAQKIQHFFRRRKEQIKFKTSVNEQKHVHFAKNHILDSASIAQAKENIDQPCKLSTLPKADDGRTPVYFPKDARIVIKESRDMLESNRRFSDSVGARSTCLREGYRHLIIPKAKPIKKYLVEERLPISGHGLKEQIDIYSKHRNEFTDAVKEFTAFTLTNHVSDIRGTRSPVKIVGDFPLPRYDNFILYIDTQDGLPSYRIGMVDLEHFKPAPKGLTKAQMLESIKGAITLFPHHFDTIIETALRYYPEVREKQAELKILQEKVLTFHQNYLENHVQHLEEKGIQVSAPWKEIEITPARKDEIITVISDKIQALHEYKGPRNSDIYFPGILGSQPTESIQHLKSELIPSAIGSTLQMINQSLQKKALKVSSTDLSNPSSLSNARSLFFNRNDHFEPFKNLISSFTHLLKWEEDLAHVQIHLFPMFIMKTIMEELVKGKEISAQFSDLCQGETTLIVLC